MIYIKVKRVVVRILRPCWQQTIGLATFLAIFEYFGGDFFLAIFEYVGGEIWQF